MKLTVLTLAVTLLLAPQVHADPFTGKIVCTKTGSEGSTVKLTVENDEASHYPQVIVDSDVIYHTDLSPTPLRSKSHASYSPDKLDLTVDRQGQRHISGDEPYRGGCLDSCPTTVITLDLASNGKGSYSIKNSVFDDVTGGPKETVLSSFSDMTCADSK